MGIPYALIVDCLKSQSIDNKKFLIKMKTMEIVYKNLDGNRFDNCKNQDKHILSIILNISTRPVTKLQE